jgi:hypothetical protein
MNALSVSIKCASIGFLVGFLASVGPDVGADILPLAVLLAFIGTTLVLWELTNPEPATSVDAKAV